MTHDSRHRRMHMHNQDIRGAAGFGEREVRIRADISQKFQTRSKGLGQDGMGSDGMAHTSTKGDLAGWSWSWSS